MSGRQLLGLPAKANTGEAIAQQRTPSVETRVPCRAIATVMVILGVGRGGAPAHSPSFSPLVRRARSACVCRPVGRQLADEECSCRGSPRWMWGAAAAASLRLRSASMESISLPHNAPPQPLSHRARVRACVCIVNKDG